MPGIRSPLMINGVPVVTAPAELDATTAEQLRAVLLRAAARRHTTIVVDMTGTRFCDSAGLTVLIRAHRRTVAHDGELRLVIPAGSAVSRIFAITALDRVIPLFGSLDEALPPRPAAVIRQVPRRPAAGRPFPGSPAAQSGGPELAAENILEISVRAGQSGPVITLSGEADITNADQLSTLISTQLSDGMKELTVDMSGLRFADTAAIRALVLANRTMKEQGGSLVLVDPQRPVARVLALLGVDQMITIRGVTEAAPLRETDVVGVPVGEDQRPDVCGRGPSQPAPGQCPCRSRTPRRR